MQRGMNESLRPEDTTVGNVSADRQYKVSAVCDGIFFFVPWEFRRQTPSVLKALVISTDPISAGVLD